MVTGTERDRWPPVYDADDLQVVISKLSAGDLEAQFWTSIRDDVPVCQGDIISLDAGVPIFDETGEASISGDFRQWLVIGNTCDFSRSVSEVRWSQIVPIERFSDGEIEPGDLRDLRRYMLFRRFFLPPWPSGEPAIYIADLLRPVAIDKRVLASGELTVARMSRSGWMLLHACLVRFLARDDGRDAA